MYIISIEKKTTTSQKLVLSFYIKYYKIKPSLRMRADLKDMWASLMLSVLLLSASTPMEGVPTAHGNRVPGSKSDTTATQIYNKYIIYYDFITHYYDLSMEIQQMFYSSNLQY